MDRDSNEERRLAIIKRPLNILARLAFVIAAGPGGAPGQQSGRAKSPFTTSSRALPPRSCALMTASSHGFRAFLRLAAPLDFVFFTPAFGHS